MEFLFQAKNQTGDLVQGSIEAPSDDQAVVILQQKNLFIINLERAPKSLASKDLLSFLNRSNRKDVVVFTRQLSTLVEAEVPLVESLSTLAKQATKESFKKVISTIVASVEGGATLSVALAEHDDVFTPFYVSLVKVGEVSGRLQETLTYLADYLERSASLNSKIKGALMYPAFIFSALIVVGTILMTTVIPQLLLVIKESGVTELPLPTKILLFVTSVIDRFVFVFIILLIVAIVAIYQYVQTTRGHYQWDRFKIRMPQFGNIVQNLYLARIAETLATLIKAGVPILDSLEITADVVGNDVYKNILIDARKNVQAGGTISEVLLANDDVPGLVGSMMQTGEKTGKTVSMLENILKFYKAEAENGVQNLSALIEPILMLILGVGVGILVSAVLLPIYSLVNAA